MRPGNILLHIPEKPYRNIRFDRIYGNNNRRSVTDRFFTAISGLYSLTGLLFFLSSAPSETARSDVRSPLMTHVLALEPVARWPAYALLILYLSRTYSLCKPFFFLPKVLWPGKQRLVGAVACAELFRQAVNIRVNPCASYTFFYNLCILSNPFFNL